MIGQHERQVHLGELHHAAVQLKALGLGGGAAPQRGIGRRSGAEVERAISSFCFDQCLSGVKNPDLAAPSSSFSDSSSVRGSSTDDSFMSSEADLGLLFMWESRCLALETELQIRQKVEDGLSKKLDDLRSGKREVLDTNWRLQEELCDLQTQLAMEKKSNAELKDRIRWTEDVQHILNKGRHGGGGGGSGGGRHSNGSGNGSGSGSGKKKVDRDFNVY